MSTSNQPTGWIAPSQRPVAVQKQIEIKLDQLPKFLIRNRSKIDDHSRLVSWIFEQKIDNQEYSRLGEMFPTTEQRIGSCVGHGIFNVIWRMMAMERVRLGESENVVMPYLPYNYAISRIEIGKEKYGYNFGNDPSGSLGYLAAEGARDYGVLRFDTDNLAQPNLRRDRHGMTLVWPGKVDGQWAVRGVPDQYETIGKEHPVRTVTQVKGWEQIKDALLNGYWITAAWMFDLSDRTSLDRGKHWVRRSRTVGGHQVCLIGIDNDNRRQGAFMLNSWGADFYGEQADGPAGGVWVDADDLDRISRDRDAEFFAFSQFEGYPEQDFSWMLI